MNVEWWKPVVGYEYNYVVSSLGNVRSVPHTTLTSNGQTRRYQGKLLRPGTDSNGYQIVVLLKNGIETPRRVHVLVLEAFVGPRPARADACHGNAVKSDNRLENLRWDTRQNNLLERGPYKRRQSA